MYRTHVEEGWHICPTMCAGQALCLIQKPGNECVLLFIARPWGFCDARKSSVWQQPSDSLCPCFFLLSPSSIYLHVSPWALYFSPCCRPSLLEVKILPQSLLRSTPGPAKTRWNAQTGAGGPAEGRPIHFYGPRSSKSVLFIRQRVTTTVISWHFPNTAALDIGRTLQSQHVVTVADCVWRSTWNVFSANRLKIWPARHYNIILMFSIQCNNTEILWNALCYDIYICLLTPFPLLLLCNLCYQSKILSNLFHKAW